MASATMRPKNGVLISVARRGARPEGLEVAEPASRQGVTKERTMGRKSMLTNDITDPYSNVNAWMYDKMFAPAVLDMVREDLTAWCAALRPGARVLDVGCGGGQMALAMMAQRDDIHITGIDLSAAQVKRARKRSKDLGDRARYEVASALELPFDDSSFDAVLSVTSIKHWPSPLHGMQESLRVLRPGGDLFVAEVNHGSRLEAVRALMARSRVPRPLRGAALPLLAHVHHRTGHGPGRVPRARGGSSAQRQPRVASRRSAGHRPDRAPRGGPCRRPGPGRRRRRSCGRSYNPARARQVARGRSSHTTRTRGTSRSARWVTM